jgi:hypothetical protein
MTLDDTGALADPLVVGLDHPCQIMIRQNFLRQIAARRHDDGLLHD